MTLTSFLIFDRNGTCLFEYHPIPTHQPNHKLVYGLLFTLSSSIFQLTSQPNVQSNTQIDSEESLYHSLVGSIGSGKKFISYQTKFYNLHYYESPTKLKFVCFLTRGDTSITSLDQTGSSMDTSNLSNSTNSSNYSWNRAYMKERMKNMYLLWCDWVKTADYEWGEQIVDSSWNQLVEKTIKDWNV